MLKKLVVVLSILAFAKIAFASGHGSSVTESNKDITEVEKGKEDYNKKKHDEMKHDAKHDMKHDEKKDEKKKD